MKQKNQSEIFRAIILAFVCALIINLIIKLFLFDLVVIQGRSMLPTLKSGSLLIVNKAAYGFRLPVAGQYIIRWAAPKPGDIVVFYTPFGEKAVKRCSNVSNNGDIYALGDNSLESFDSRSYGLVPANHILGRVTSIK